MPDKPADPAPVASPWKSAATHVSVKSPAGPHWRAGRQWGREPVTLAKADLTDRQAEMLLGDPQLVVVEVADPAAAPAAASAATK